MVEFYRHNGINYSKKWWDELQKSFDRANRFNEQQIRKTKKLVKKRKNPMLLNGPVPEKVFKDKPMPKVKSYRRASQKVIYRANDNR